MIAYVILSLAAGFLLGALACWRVVGWKVRLAETREVFVLEEKVGDSWAIANVFETREKADEEAMAGDRVVRYVPEEHATATQIEILNSNILALIELLTYDGARTRGEGSVLVGEKLDEYRERTAALDVDPLCAAVTITEQQRQRAQMQADILLATACDLLGHCVSAEARERASNNIELVQKIRSEK